jgi:hypothetical protein
MIAGERLTRLARGASAKRAAAAYLRRQGGAALSEEERAEADELDATLEAMFLMAAVDGQVGSDEIARLTATIEALFGTRDRGAAPGADRGTDRGPDVDGVLVHLGTSLERDGWTARLDAVAERLVTAEARAFAFRLSAALVFVDDHLAHAEAAALRALAAALDLDGATTQHIIEDVQDALAEG